MPSPDFGQNVDFDPVTGLTVTGWPAVFQSIGEIIITPLGVRIMHEWVGSEVPNALGRDASESRILSLIQSVAVAIDLFEPRFKVKKIPPLSLSLTGRLELRIIGEYYPGALFGDFSTSVQKDFILSI